MAESCHRGDLQISRPDGVRLARWGQANRPAGAGTSRTAGKDGVRYRPDPCRHSAYGRFPEAPIGVRDDPPPGEASRLEIGPQASSTRQSLTNIGEADDLCRLSPGELPQALESGAVHFRTGSIGGALPAIRPSS